MEHDTLHTILFVLEDTWTQVLNPLPTWGSLSCVVPGTRERMSYVTFPCSLEAKACAYNLDLANCTLSLWFQILVNVTKTQAKVPESSGGATGVEWVKLRDPDKELTTCRNIQVAVQQKALTARLSSLLSFLLHSSTKPRAIHSAGKMENWPPALPSPSSCHGSVVRDITLSELPLLCGLDCSPCFLVLVPACFLYLLLQTS